MIPRTILRQLARLRRRERLLALGWGLARGVALAAAVLFLACLTDWTIDRWQDTPWAVRYALCIGQAILWLALVGLFVVRPLLRRLTDSSLALHVEERIPDLRHRLVSAVQLNAPRADTAGMSPELIAAVTQQAEEQAAPLHLASLADHRRLRWSLGVLTPLALGVGALLLLCPETTKVLLSRQLLADQEIPRAYHIECEQNKRVCPAGEEVVLRFRVQGRTSAQPGQGEVLLSQEGLPVERYPLEREEVKGQDEAIYVAHIPPTAVDFSYHAWLQDARLRHPGEVHLEPLPAVVQLRAWGQMPEYFGHRRDGKPYEREQPSGECSVLPQSTIRVAIRTQKPVHKAYLEVLGPVSHETEPAVREPVLRRVDLSLDGEGQAAEGTFRPRPQEAAYRVIVADAYGFQNVDPPRRGIRILPDEPPQVALLPELFPSPDGQGSMEDFEVSGIPVPMGGSIRIAYTCSSPQGLGRADQNRSPRLCYRVNEGQWSRLPLQEVAASEKTGPFDPRFGAFEKSRFLDQVEYHAVPSATPDSEPGRLEGGGRFDFQTRKIPGLKLGDRIELALEVYDQNPASGREPARSESRIKTIVSLPEVETWVRETLQEESRIRQLEGKQRGIFMAANNPEDDPLETVTAASSANMAKPSLSPERPEGTVSSFVRSWQLLGIFPAEGEQGHDRVYPPETEPLDLSRSYDGVNGKISWKLAHSSSDMIDLDQLLGRCEVGTAYAGCWVHTDRPRKLMLAVGSDDGIKVWINRRLVLDRKGPRSATPAEDRETVELSAGWNEVLVKIDNLHGGWAFYFELRDPANDRPAPRLKLRSTPLDIAHSPCLRQWLLVGPFPNPDDHGHNEVYPPETDPVDLAHTYETASGKVAWKLHHSERDKIDLAQALDHEKAGVAYAVCWVHSSHRKAILATGSDDGIKVWINHKLVLDRPVHREAVRGEDRVPVDLRDGWNEVRVKIDNRFGTWAFFLELRDPDHELPLPGLQLRTNPISEAEMKAQLQGEPVDRFVRTWQLLGPFASPQANGHGTVYPPESQKTDLTRHYDGLHGKIRWQKHHNGEEVLNLAEIFHHNEFGVAYAVCWIHSDRSRPALLSLGCDDGIKIWIDRKQVADFSGRQSVSPGQYNQQVQLKPGWQEVLVKVDNDGGSAWGFCLEIQDSSSRQPLKDVKVRTDPPEGTKTRAHAPHRKGA